MNHNKLLGLIDRLAYGKDPEAYLEARLMVLAHRDAGAPPMPDLPEPRPVPGKSNRAPKRKKRLITPGEVAMRPCPKCGAGPGEPCITLRTTKHSKAGDKATNYHDERSGRKKLRQP